MTQEDKDLLLKDLCNRLPYGVKCQVYDFPSPYTLSGIIPSKVYQELYFDEMDYKECDGLIDIQYSKPYLFPLSSMTEEQKEELFNLCEFCIREDWEGKKSEIYAIEIASRLDPAYCYDHTFHMWSINMRVINWLLKNHFDINGLIPKGLAIDATRLKIY